MINPEKAATAAGRSIPLLWACAVYAFLILMLYQASIMFNEYHPGKPWPGLLSVIRTFTFLPLHEGGHFLFILFGQTLYTLGGSFWQITFPLLWFIIAARQRSRVAPFALFWVGENMMDVSLYIRDAAYRALPLLGGHSSGHDWVRLLTTWGAMESSESIADAVYFIGITISSGAILGGIIWAVADLVRFPRTADTAESVSELSRDVEASLDDALNRDTKIG